jgi:hypothetical protein
MELYTYSQTKWNTPCSDDFFWKIIHDFCWGNVDCLSWEDFYNQLNAKIVNFSYSENVMNMLYEFITKKAYLLHSRLFPKNYTLCIDSTIIKSILEEIVSRGVDFYETVTVETVYDMYIHNKYTIPGGLCSMFTTFGGGVEGYTTLNSIKIMKCEYIPPISNFSSGESVCSSEEEYEYV